MPLQDLTPQLRTRLNRMERAVGWFIMIATVLLLFGFGYYLHYAATQRGWFKEKAKFFIYAQSAKGIQVGDSVDLMGREVGHVIKLEAMPPTYGTNTPDNIYVEFDVFEPYFGYLWTEGTQVELTSSGFLDKRDLNLSKGTGGHAIYITQPFRHDLSIEEAEALPDLDKWHLGQDVFDGTNIIGKAWQALSTDLLHNISGHLGTNHLRVIDARAKGKKITAVWNEHEHRYDPQTVSNVFELHRNEQTALGDRLQAMVAQIQAALPGVLAMTNQLATVLSNASQLTSNLNQISSAARPMVTNLAAITAHLTNSSGSLGEWLIPTNINQKLDTTLETATVTITNLNTNLLTLNLTLDNLANITSNLNNQVQANTNILTNISDIVVHTDQFIQGLKKFWLFRHLFSAHPAKNSSPASTHQAEPALSPKQKGE